MPTALLIALFAIPPGGPPSHEVLGQEKADPAKKPEDDTLMTAMGGTLAVSAYSTCQYIGAMADGYAHDVYKPDFLWIRMRALEGGLNVIVKQVEALVKDESVAANDKAYLKSVVENLKTLMLQADSLRKYARTRKPEHLKTFRESRARAWELAASLLQLNEEMAGKLAPGGKTLGK